MKGILKINGLNVQPPKSTPEKDIILPNNTKDYNTIPFFKET